MYTIADSKLLLRAHVELPADFRLRTADFQEDWRFVQNTSAKQLRRKTRTLGWNFVQGAKGLPGSGVGDTSQLAIASALKLALRNVAKQWNAAEIQQIALTHYPWFYLAKLSISSYHIHHTLLLPESDEDYSLTPIAHRSSSDLHASELQLGCSIPELKQMLVLPNEPEELKL